MCVCMSKVGLIVFGFKKKLILGSIFRVVSLLNEKVVKSGQTLIHSHKIGFKDSTHLRKTNQILQKLIIKKVSLNVLIKVKCHVHSKNFSRHR